MKNTNSIKSWMKSNLDNYIDKCGELDITKLAEDAIIKFNVVEEDETTIFELSSSFCK